MKIAVFCATVLTAAMALPAWAQTQPDGKTIEGDEANQPSPTPPAKVVQPLSAPYKRYDALAMKGWERPLPSTADTVLGDRFGVRDTLADAGIGVQGLLTAGFQTHLADGTRGYSGPQIYNAQKFTRTNTSQTLFVTYDLGKVGLDGGQLIFSGINMSNGFNRVNGPNSTRVARLAYFQSLFDKKVQFKIGIFDNGFEFMGTQVGGSFAGGALGPQASIPNQVGMSYMGFASPSANVRVNFANHVYTKVGIQRSFPPGAAPAEARYNHDGLRFSVPGTGALLIDEVGMDRPASAGTKAMWIRAGGMFNTTDFPKFDGGVSKSNWAGYLAVDRQLTQISATQPGRGLYVGGTVNYAPPAQNFITQYYEARVYGVGLLPSRPFDLASVIVNSNVYSGDGLLARTPATADNYKATFSVIAGYAYRLAPGLYAQPGVGAVVHPVYSPRFGTSFNAYLNLSVFL
ncbi:porin [Sphingobium sp. AP50]|uniref:carbohydrate porin n=1 Tax=Sphingobium sp. AP50 TaxID=1884369 RepID=UPI0008CC0490|nr:carbohydrate porin [Sphingobium sp. AP50]SEJ90353.1 porin [Sphingobium sp. AP50]